MKQFSIEFQAELDKGRNEPRTLLDVYELYDYDTIPTADGLDPADALETFAAEEITWNGIAYRREVKSRSDIVKAITERTNSVTVTFSNISRHMATLAQTQQIEGLILVIRTISPDVTNDSDTPFIGRCGQPSDIDKGEFFLEARQDFGNINVTLPPRRFTADDSEGRLPSDPLFEGFPFFAVAGSYAFPYVRQSNGVLGRLFGRRTTDRRSEQWSSVVDTPYGSPVPEVFGRCQMELIPIAAVDKGIYIGGMWVASNGPIAGIGNITTRLAGISDPLCTFEPQTPAAVHLGDAGGTGTNQGNTCQADLGGGLMYSHTAYIDGAVIPTEYFQNKSLSDPNVLNELPTVTALIMGRIVPLPDGSGEYTLEGWTDNPVHIARFILTEFVGLDSGFMDDAVNYKTGLRCDFPVIDDSEFVVVSSVDASLGGTEFTRYRSTGLINTRSILYNELADDSIIPDTVDGPYIGIDPIDPPDPLFCPIGQHRDPVTGLCVDNPAPPGPTPPPINALQPQLRKRFTVNCPITAEVRAVDFLNKTIFAAAGLFLRVGKTGKYQILDEHAADNTRLRSATAVGASSIPVLDATLWKTGELLTGRLVLGVGLETAEVRNVTSADYSTSGNSITLAAVVTGSVTATASGATLTGGSTTVQASGTVTIGGTPSGSVSITIDGKTISYIANASDTVETIAGMLAAYINATPRLAQYISAERDGANVVIKCKHGALNVDSAFLKVHGGPIADPTTAPTIAAAASGSLQAGTYQVAYADVNANGLTALTLIASVVLLAGQKINVSALPAFPAGVTSRQFFVSDSPDSPRLRYHTTRNDAADFSINSLPLPGAAVPPSSNTTAEEAIRVAMSFATNSQDIFPAWRPQQAVTLLAGDGGPNVFLPTVLNGHKYQVTTAGTTGTSEPTWPTGAGATVASGTAVFTEIGSTVLQQAGLTRSNVIKNTFHASISPQSSVNAVKGSFRDAKNDFALTPYRVVDRDHYDKVKKWYEYEFDGSAIDNFNQFYRRSNAILAQNREGGTGIKLETGPSGLVLEEGDPICASDDAEGMVNLVTRIREIRIKPNHQVAITYANRYSTRMYSDDVGSHVIPIASTLRHVQTLDSLAEFIDTPAIREADLGRSGFYVSVSRDLALEGDWRGFDVYVDYGDGDTKVAQGDVAATIGEATTTLNDVVDPAAFDTINELTFTLKYAAPVIPFVSCTQADLEANPLKNLFLIGDEYVQAASIVDNGNRSFTISDLYHARSETECVDHAIGERVVYVDGAEVFIPTDPTRIGIEYNYKFVTTNQDVADAAVVPFTWLGELLRPAKPTDLNAERDTSDDWYISAVGHPTDIERPESYMARIRRVSDGVTMRDIPIRPGIQLAAVFDNITGVNTVSKNNMYGTSSVLGGTARTKQLITNEGTEVNAVFSVPSAFSLSESVGISLGGTKWAIAASRIDDTSTRVSYNDWAGGSPTNVTIATVDSVVYVRIILVGTELKFFFSGSALLPSSPPNVILHDAPDFPLPSSCYLEVTALGVSVKVERVTISGLRHPATIYTIEQQEEDNSGSGLSTVDVEMWQTSPIPGVQGRSIRGVF